MKPFPALPVDFSAPAAAGVFRLPPDRIAAVSSAARSAGCCVRHIDLQGARGKADVLARIAAALDFPAWFGHNWDALADCLADLGWLPPDAGYVFILEGCSGREDALPILLEILEQAVADWLERDVALWVLLAGDGGAAT